MTKPLFQLGEFQFDLANGSPQTLDWQADYRWEEQGRLLRDPAQQFVGPGSQAITLDGILFPGFSGRQNTVEDLRALAREGKPLMLTDGLGKVYGRWAIKSLREGKGVFMDNGAARRIDFSIQLVFYGEDSPGEAASPFSIQPTGNLANLASQATAGLNFTGAGSAFGAIDWSQATQWQGLTQQAAGAGFSLGQLGMIASTGAQIATQVASGNYVNAALGTFGLFGFNPAQATGWQALGVNAANLAQSHLNGAGPAGMALAVEAMANVGAPAMVDAGVLAPGNVTAVTRLLEAAATVTTLLTVDPKITDSLRPLVLP